MRKLLKIYKIFFIFLVLTILIAKLYPSGIKSINQKNNLILERIPNISGHWELNFIHIDNNWSDTALNYDWCTGLGTQISPYIIENVTIDGKQMYNCIIIENTDDYFIINNCTLYNSTDLMMLENRAGIKLNNVSNGILIGNNCSYENYNGIYCKNSEDLQILENILNDNYNGIQLNVSERCSIIGNMVNKGTNVGIVLLNSRSNFVYENELHQAPSFGIACIEGSRNNTISHNNASFNYHGVVIDLNSPNNTIFHNFANFNYFGIALGRSNESIVIENIVENNEYGIMLTNASQNQFSENYIYNNSYYGVYLIEVYGSCDNNVFYNNDLINNTEAGIYIDKPLHFGNIFYNNEFVANKLHVFDNGTNTIWDNGNIGNYWDNYSGSDLNDDGFGDTEHIIQNTPLRLDNFPIWDDGDDIAPNIIINFPSNGAIYNITAPIFNFFINDYYGVHQAWYTLNNIQTKHFFTPSIGINILQINQSAWNLLSEGNITVIIFVNDSASHLTSESITLIKNIVEDGTLDISFGYAYIIIVSVGIIILIKKTNWKKKL